MTLRRIIGARWSSTATRASRLPPRASTIAKFDFPLATHTISQINSNLSSILKNDGKVRVTLNGHLHKKPRIMTKLSFAEIRDHSGEITQIMLAPGVASEEVFELLKCAGTEDSVSVTGHVQLKQSSGGTSEWELAVESFQVLNHANLDAARLDKLKHSAPQDLPAQFRYLQLRTPYYQKALRTRSMASKVVRDTLAGHDFVEIETPLLFKSTPEGAREFLVPTRTPQKLYALPQSPQQYKQILMSSGFTRYFQLAKCFRDEDLRADRQPEFTQIDLEMSYISSSSQVMEVVEDVVQNVWKKVGKSEILTLNSEGSMSSTDSDNIENGFFKLDYIDALRKYGIDKPDLRSSLSFVDLSTFFAPVSAPADFPVVEACVLKQAGTKIPKSLTENSQYSRRKPYVVAIKSEEDAQNWYKKFVDKHVLAPTSEFNHSKLASCLNLGPGDILAFSTRSHMPYENPTPLGKFRQLAIAEYPGKWNRPIIQNGKSITDYDPEKVFVGSWVVNFPLFNPIDLSGPEDEYPKYNYNAFESTHHPFTMAKTDDYDLLGTDPLKVHGEHYDLVINGVEVGGGSRRIHDSALQSYVFEEILKIQNYHDLFGHLLKALSMGCPPHAGLAIGFDRMCAMLIGSSSIRDVIAFPKNQSGSDPVVDSPTAVDEMTLNQYHIKSVNSS